MSEWLPVTAGRSIDYWENHKLNKWTFNDLRLFMEQRNQLIDFISEIMVNVASW